MENAAHRAPGIETEPIETHLVERKMIEGDGLGINKNNVKSNIN